MKPIKLFLKWLINTLLGALDLEISRKHALGQGYSASPDDSRLLASVQVAGSPPASAYEANPLLKYFLSASSKDLHKWFHYFEVYDRFFARFKSRPNLRILEIGVFRGGSLKMWKNYFGSSCTIVGVDINPDCQKLESKADSIFVRIGPQQNHEFLSSIIQEFGPFDIIIDDGSHISEHMISSFNLLFPQGLVDDGVYLVEDTHTNYWEIEQGEPSDKTFMFYAKGLVDRLHEPYSKYLKLNFFDFDDRNKIMQDHFSYFFNHTKGISFFDSIVVFEKCPNKPIPAHQIR